jgi:hypothetical protein
MSEAESGETMKSEKLDDIREKHSRKPSLIRRLKDAGLDG